MSEPLFNPKPDKIVTAYDWFGKKHKKNLKDFKFRVSSYGVLYRKNEILVQRPPKVEKFGLPGGAVEIVETINEALVREFREETGLKVESHKLITVTEDYFTCNSGNEYSVLIFYMVKKIGGKLLVNGNNDDVEEVKFISLKELSKNNTQRVFWPVIKGLVNESW